MNGFGVVGYYVHREHLKFADGQGWMAVLDAAAGESCIIGFMVIVGRCIEVCES